MRNKKKARGKRPLLAQLHGFAKAIPIAMTVGKAFAYICYTAVLAWSFSVTVLDPNVTTVKSRLESRIEALKATDVGDDFSAEILKVQATHENRVAIQGKYKGLQRDMNLWLEVRDEHGRYYYRPVKHNSGNFANELRLGREENHGEVFRLRMVLMASGSIISTGPYCTPVSNRPVGQPMSIYKT